MAWAASRRTCPAFVVFSSGAQGHQRRVVELGLRLLADGVPGRAVPQRRRSGAVSCRTRRASMREMQRDSLDTLARLNQQAARRGRRPGNRHADQFVRDGLSDADQRAGTDGPFRASRRKRSQCTAPSRARRRSPTTACSRGGWSNAACGSCSCSTKRGTITAA